VTHKGSDAPSPIDGLSIVVPAYNEAERIGASLEKIAAYCRSSVKAYEIIVVDDGSTDGTGEVASRVVGEDDGFVLLTTPKNRGKGHAVRTGALAARYPYVLLSDADLSTPIEETDKLALHASPDTVVVASRGLPDSDLEERQPFYRETMGKVFNLMVRMLLVPGVADTQCGFKLFGKGVSNAIFPPLQTERFAFDVELLARAIRLGFPVVEVPVRWKNDLRSRVHPIRDSALMMRDVLRVWFMLNRQSAAEKR